MVMDRVLMQAVFAAIFSTLVSSQSCVSIAPNPTTTTRVLLDTYNLTSLPWTSFTSDSFFRENVNCRPFIEVNGGAFEVATDFITKPPGLLTVSITIDYEGQCGGTDTNPFPCIMGLNILSSSTQTNDRSSLMNSPSVALGEFFSGSNVNANVSDVGFQLYFTGSSVSGSSISVNITRVRVTYEVCLEATLSLVRYGETIVGRTASGTCVGNSAEVSTSLMATCQSNAMFMSSSSCQCDAGYGLSSTGQQCDPCDIGTFKKSAGNGMCDACPSNSNTSGIASTMCPCNDRYQRPSRDGPCSECTAGNFLLSGMCTTCPEGSESSGGTSTSCTCMSGLVTGNEEERTFNLACDRCMTNRFRRQQDECIECPDNSERMFTSSENTCNCIGNTATSRGQNTTTDEACSGCVDNFYLKSGSCIACPSNSVSESPEDISCRCRLGTSRVSGNPDDPCSSCAVNYFRESGGVCIDCPDNSQRLSATDPDNECICIASYARQPDRPSSDQCSPHVGFSEAIISFNEGGDYDIPVRLSAQAGSDFDVSISVNPSQYVSDTSVTFQAGSTMASIPVNIADNDIALENRKMFSIALQSSPEGVVGEDPNYLPTIQVNINDNDTVDVGFTLSTARYNESSKNTNLQITRIQEIANSFTLKIENDNNDLVKLSSSEITITPMSKTETVPFEIVDNVAGDMPDRTVTLTIMYSRPSEYMNSVIIGGDTTFKIMKIVIMEDDASVPPSPFPVEGIIGAAVAAAGLAVLLLIIIILCFCIFRLQANRQGFYPTHEDKTTEAPTMIRYSASLRSISSQTVMGISEGKSVPRENEFYV